MVWSVSGNVKGGRESYLDSSWAECWYAKIFPPYVLNKKRALP